MELISEFYGENQTAKMMKDNHLLCKNVIMYVILSRLSLQKHLLETTSVAHSWLEG